MKSLKRVPKFCLISHVLPPSSSGQAIVLYKLLNGINHQDYCLLSRQNYNRKSAISKDSRFQWSNYYYLKPAFHLAHIDSRLISQSINLIVMLSNLVFRTWQIILIVKKEKCASIVACSGDLLDLPASYLASKLAGVRLITYLFDDYVYQWTGVKRRFSKLLEPIVIRSSKSVIVPNEFLHREYKHRYGINCVIINNPCCISNHIDASPIKNLFNSTKPNIIYTGSVYHANFDAFLRLIKALDEIEKDKINLHIFTDQPKNILEDNKIKGVNVFWHPHVPNENVPFILKKADILFLPLAFDSPIPEVIKTSAPGKLAEYLASGVPILAHAPSDTFVAWLFKKHKCGIVIDCKDTKKLAHAISKLIHQPQLRKHLGRRARKLALKNFDIKRAQKKFVECVNFS